MATTQELLDDIEAAIKACLAGEEVTIRGRTVRRPKLSDLIDARNQLQSEAAQDETSMGEIIQVNSAPLSRLR